MRARTPNRAVPLGLATLLVSCAAHQPAPSPMPPRSESQASPPPASSAAADPFAGLAGKIVILRRPPDKDDQTVADFVAQARASQTDRLSPNEVREGADRSWNLHFAAFLAGASTKREVAGGTKRPIHVEIRFVDLTGDKREHVADGGWSADAGPGPWVVNSAVQLVEPWFVGDRRYEMTVEIDRVATASTTFWLLAERSAPPLQSLDVASGSPRREPEDIIDRVRRVSAAGACPPDKPFEGAQRDHDLRTMRSSPGLRFTSPDKETIRQFIRQRVPSIRACYNRAMTTRPYPEGRLRARIVIAPDGRVRGSCAIDSELNNTALDLCILDDLLTLRLPESINAGWEVVDYPFVLRPGDDDEPALPARD